MELTTGTVGEINITTEWGGEIAGHRGNRGILEKEFDVVGGKTGGFALQGLNQRKIGGLCPHKQARPKREKKCPTLGGLNFCRKGGGGTELPSKKKKGY